MPECPKVEKDVRIFNGDKRSTAEYSAPNEKKQWFDAPEYQKAPKQVIYF